MTPKSNDPDRRDLMDLAQLLRQERPQPTALQRDQIKSRVLRRGQTVRRRGPFVLGLRTRFLMLALLVGVFAMNMSNAAASVFGKLVGASGGFLGITPGGWNGKSLPSGGNGGGAQYVFGSLSSSLGNEGDSESDSESDSDEAAESEYCPDDRPPGGDTDSDSDSEAAGNRDSDSERAGARESDSDQGGQDSESDGSSKENDSESDSEECESDDEGQEPRMTGGGHGTPTLTPAGQVVHHGFQLRCDPADERQNLEVNWGKGQNFHMENLTSAQCLDDPSVVANPPVSNFDTYVGTGTGRLNKGNGSAEWCYVDAGEPGKDGDRFTITVRDAGGTAVLFLNSAINQGNHQAHGSFSPGPAPAGSCPTPPSATRAAVLRKKK